MLNETVKTLKQMVKTLKAKLKNNQLEETVKTLNEMVKTLKAKLESITCNMSVTRDLRPVSPVHECYSFGCVGYVDKNKGLNALNSTLLSKLYPIEVYHECTVGKKTGGAIDEDAIKIMKAVLTFTNGASIFLTYLQGNTYIIP
jgi:hypothetical protein